MSKGNENKNQQLGMNAGTAAHRLRKIIIYDFAKQLNKDICHQCGEKIETIDEFSIEHKVPYLDSEDPVDLFFDLNNIAFSHLKCNVGSGRRPNKKDHPSLSSYKKGCRCDDCRELKKIERRTFIEKRQMQHAL